MLSGVRVNPCPATDPYIRFQASIAPNKIPLVLIKYFAVDAQESNLSLPDLSINFITKRNIFKCLKRFFESFFFKIYNDHILSTLSPVG